MHSVIERDWRTQLKFAEELIHYEEDLRTLCRTMDDHIEASRSHIKAENAALALSNLQLTVATIRKLLPGIVEFGELQKTLALKLKDIEEKNSPRRR